MFICSTFINRVAAETKTVSEMFFIKTKNPNNHPKSNQAQTKKSQNKTTKNLWEE